MLPVVEHDQADDSADDAYDSQDGEQQGVVLDP